MWGWFALAWLPMTLPQYIEGIAKSAISLHKEGHEGFQ
jgi:hypothetical protein